jgi:hypothetical protein
MAASRKQCEPGWLGQVPARDVDRLSDLLKSAPRSREETMRSGESRVIDWRRQKSADWFKGHLHACKIGAGIADNGMARCQKRY